MSSIIAELVDIFNHPVQEKSDLTYQRMLLPEPATKDTKVVNIIVAEGHRDVRLPWTHKKDGVDFHSL